MLKNDLIHQAPGFRVVGRVETFIPTLEASSRERITKSKEFTELKEKIEKARKEKDRASVSLLEDAKSKAERKKDKEKEESELKEMRDENVVVRKSDIQLGEALNILRDLVEVSHQKGAASMPQGSNSR